jgi:hypothetical protein
MSASAGQVQQYAVIAGVVGKPIDLRQPQSITVKRHHGFQIAGLAGNPYLERRLRDHSWRRVAALLELGQRVAHEAGYRRHEIRRVPAAGVNAFGSLATQRNNCW